MEDDLIGKVVYFEWDGLVGLAKIISKDNGNSYYCELLGDLRGRGHGRCDNRWHVNKRAMNLVDNSMSLSSTIRAYTTRPILETISLGGDSIRATTLSNEDIRSYTVNFRERPFVCEESHTIRLGF